MMITFDNAHRASGDVQASDSGLVLLALPEKAADHSGQSATLSFEALLTQAASTLAGTLRGHPVLTWTSPKGRGEK